ncbi:hypothetical protein CW693_03435 [Candidatus Bathyarchaeota archaeon]|nr:MAG: hypothetical protein CW693_03435 [Candidatus Bathyarchaeota archaeon]RLI15925.1 MAG: hypothetical protein DRO41_03290 [Candidatus Bathyarchaeota archaeon]
MATMKIAEVLEMLEDGRWHTLKEIREKIKLSENKIQQIVEFLKGYGFVLMDEEKGWIKLDETVKEFLRQTATS